MRYEIRLHGELQNKNLFYMSRAHAAYAIQSANHAVNSLDAENIRSHFRRLEEHIWELDAKTAATFRMNQMLSSMNASDAIFQEDARQELERLMVARKNTITE